MGLTPRTPFYRTTVGPLDKADPAAEVAIDISGFPGSWLRITPSKAPDGLGVYHLIAINEESPVKDITSGDAYVLALDSKFNKQLLIRTIFISAGADATTFEVEVEA